MFAVERMARMKANDNTTSTHTDDLHKLINYLQECLASLRTHNSELIEDARKLQESRDLYFDLYNFAPAGYLTIDSSGTIRYCNSSLCNLLDTKIDDILHRNITQLIDSEYHEAYFNHRKNILENTPAEACTLRMHKGKNNFIYARMESSHRQDAYGNVNQHSVLLDITPCILAGQSLKKTVEELTKSNTELEQFVYIASHDLREPLRNISSCTQILNIKYNYLFDTESQELMRGTVESATQMNSLIHDLLLYSKHRKSFSCFETLDCNNILENVLDNLKHLILETKAKITFDSMPEITADNTQIIQLLQNIISNAINHNDKSPQIHVSARRQNQHWLFSITDNGPGIANEYLEKIFKTFRRLNTNNKYHGTGIGLAICKQVVENHGGKIWAESNLGVGSTFYFSITT